MLDALAIDLRHEPVPEEHEPSRGVTTAFAEFGVWHGLGVGVWEMGEGEMSDTEVNELCVILSGTATVVFVDPVREPVRLEPGSVLVLATGMRTRWIVHSGPLRKVYLTPAATGATA